MADQTNTSNQSSSENKGNPAGAGQSAGDPTSENPEINQQTKRLADEYTEDGLDEVPPHLTNNPNRNYDKPDLDKPPYS